MEYDWFSALIINDSEGTHIVSDKLYNKPRDWGTFKGEILKGPVEGNFWKWYGEYKGISYILTTQGFAGWSRLDLTWPGGSKCFWTVEEAEEFIKKDGQ